MKRLMAWLRLRRMDRRWKDTVRKNRAQYPDLLADERKHGVDPLAIARWMMDRKRNEVRAAFERGEVRYPDVWDYYMPTNRSQLHDARRERASRERDTRDLRAQLQNA